MFFHVFNSLWRDTHFFKEAIDHTTSGFFVFKLLFGNFWVDSHLFKEAIDHMFPTAVSAVGTRAMTMLILLSFSLMLWLSFFVENCNHDGWSATCLLDFQERMIVIKLFLAV